MLIYSKPGLSASAAPSLRKTRGHAGKSGYIIATTRRRKGRFSIARVDLEEFTTDELERFANALWSVRQRRMRGQTKLAPEREQLEDIIERATERLAELDGGVPKKVSDDALVDHELASEPLQVPVADRAKA
jgi:hypothetical protein